jgi:carbonic anhydrase
MSIIDKALEANRNYAKNYDPTQGKRPAPKIAVVTCMDPRLSDLPGILGLAQADIDVIRTGGPAVTRRCSRGTYCFQPSTRNHRDPASQPHRLRVHDIHG